MQGMAKLFETVQLVNKQINPRLRVSGVILTMFDAQTKLSTEVVAELEGFLDGSRGQPVPWADARVCKTKIRRNIKLAESPSFGQPVLSYDSTSNGALDYRALAREVATMRAWPSALERSLPAPPPPQSLLERTLASIERPAPASATTMPTATPTPASPPGPIASPSIAPVIAPRSPVEVIIAPTVRPAPPVKST
jgi:chromosome partitioning protein